jgi:hypothetical protein
MKHAFSPAEIPAPALLAPAGPVGAAVPAGAAEKKGIKKLGNAIVHMNRVVNQVGAGRGRACCSVPRRAAVGFASAGTPPDGS